MLFIVAKTFQFDPYKAKPWLCKKMYLLFIK